MFDPYLIGTAKKKNIVFIKVYTVIINVCFCFLFFLFCFFFVSFFGRLKSNDIDIFNPIPNKLFPKKESEIIKSIPLLLKTNMSFSEYFVFFCCVFVLFFTNTNQHTYLLPFHFASPNDFICLFKSFMAITFFMFQVWGSGSFFEVTKKYI